MHHEVPHQAIFILLLVPLYPSQHTSLKSPLSKVFFCQTKSDTYKPTVKKNTCTFDNLYSRMANWKVKDTKRNGITNSPDVFSS
jgi:hypothetical protein